MQFSSATSIAADFAQGKTTATAIIEASLAAISKLNPKVNAFTAVTGERALKKAQHLDAARASGGRLGPLAGVPFAVKDLFDIEGLPTLAGSKINRERAPAQRDAVLIERLEAAGAILTGALNMGEYAYDFTGENIHYGPSRNPHDLTRMTGGSSGGSGAAVGAGLVPIALGSDTNGSIRVPSSFCGLFGLKPTYGRLPRTRSFPFVASFDHLGPLARNVRDLALAYDAMQGPDEEDPAASKRGAEPALPSLDRGIEGLRIAKAGGYFRRGAASEVLSAFDSVAQALGAGREIELPEAQTARSAAFIITASEGAALHLGRLRHRPTDFDPAVRDRLFAGAMIPASLVVKAQKFRRWYQAEVRKLFQEVDAILAPATPCTAPLTGETILDLDGNKVPLRANIGIYTQPISFIGLPVAAVPVPVKPLPVGVQIITAPWREDIALAIAAELERIGIAHAPVPILSEGRMEIDLPGVLAEVTAAFNRYETALVTNDVETLDSLFHDDARTLRYGGGENLYGYAAIKAFRAGRSPAGLARRTDRTVITTYGKDFAVASTLFYRDTAHGKVGRQMQSWVRFPEGWRIVAAHVSIISEAE